MMITINLENEAVKAALQQLHDAGLDLTPILKNAGESLINSTKERFRTSTAPDGSRWAEKEDKTHSSMPLIGETRSLSRQIHYGVESQQLVIGSTMEYAGTQQFGANKGQYGQTKHGVPIPWGNIVARPFIGLSTNDETAIIGLIEQYLLKKIPSA